MKQLSLAALIARHRPTDGAHPTAIPGVGMMRCSEPRPLKAVVYRPSLFLVAQGSKQAFLNGKGYVYDADHFLVLSVPLPLECTIPVATPEVPFLALNVDIDIDALADLVLAVGRDEKPLQPQPGIYASTVTPELYQAVHQLVSCLDDPAAIEIVAPLAKRAILFHLLRGEQGDHLRAVAQQNPHNYQIAQVINHIHAHFAEPMTVEALSKIAHMSPSSFFEHFKAVTSSSPLRYLQSIRLHEARRLMLAESAPANDAAYRVGYSSASQFSREFKRLFGVPPMEELRRLQLER